MFYTEVILDTDVLEAVKSIPRRVTPAMALYVDRRVIPHIEQRVQATLSVYPGPVVYPFEFATEKSRRAFFATNGFGKGIPTRRTGELGRAWVVDVDRRRNEGYITIRNTAPSAIYVIGVRQVPGHRRTGWGARFDHYILDISEEANDMLIDGWVIVTDELLQ